MKKNGNILIIGREREVGNLRTYLSCCAWRVYDACNAIQGMKIMYEKPIAVVLMDSSLFNPWEMNPVQLVKSTLPVVPVFILGNVGNNLDIAKELMIEHYFHYPWTWGEVEMKLSELGAN